MSTISYAELRFGVLKMPDGKRRNDLAAQIDRALELFKDRMIEFNVKAAEQLAQIGARCKEIGKPATARMRILPRLPRRMDSRLRHGTLTTSSIRAFPLSIHGNKAHCWRELRINSELPVIGSDHRWHDASLRMRQPTSRGYPVLPLPQCRAWLQ